MLSLQQGHAADSCLADSLQDFHGLFSRAALQPLSPQRILLLRIVLCHMQHVMEYLIIKICHSCLLNLSAYQGLYVGWFFILVNLFVLPDTELQRLCLILSSMSFINTWNGIILHGTSLALCYQLIFIFCYLRLVFIKLVTKPSKRYSAKSMFCCA